MWFGVVTIFPEIFRGIIDYGITHKAIDNQQVNLNFYNPRDYAIDKRKTVDDRPYGGGPGMVMKVEPLIKAIAHAQQDNYNLNNQQAIVILLSPQGRKIVQQDLHAFIKLNINKGVIFVCGRYEGIDERLCDLVVDQEWSIGDFILSGGELVAMAFLDAMIRLIPGVLKDQNALLEDSFCYHEESMLDHPQYTRPKSIYNLAVPEVLLSGNHQKVAAWRQQQRLIRTTQRRKDLLGEPNEHKNQ